MAKKSGTAKSNELPKVIKQMDYWMQHKTRLLLSITATPLIMLCIRGRIVGRMGRLFLFDSYSEECRVPILPERFEAVMSDRNGDVSVRLEQTGEIEGSLVISEDGREAVFAETFANTVADADSRGGAFQ
jgi:hypothetical protein